MKIITIVLLVVTIICLSSVISVSDNSHINISPKPTVNVFKDSSSKHMFLTKDNTIYLNKTISINTNSGFLTCNCTSGGDGSVGNPYVIKNYFISSYSFNMISTTAYFIVNNVWITGSPSYGFDIYNVTNGVFENVTSSYNTQLGFYIEYSNNCSIVNSFLFNNHEQGLNIYSSQNITLINDNIDNNFQYGVSLVGSNFIEINSCHFFNNSIELALDDTNNSLITNNNFLSNGSFFASGIYLGLSFYNIISFNIVNKTGSCFVIDSSKYNLIQYNYAFNSSVGFSTYSASYNNFTNNLAMYNQDGFQIELTYYSEFKGNVAKLNLANFYTFDSNYNSYENNEFVDQTPSYSSTGVPNAIPQPNNNFAGLSVGHILEILIFIFIIEIVFFNFISLLRFVKRKI